MPLLQFEKNSHLTPLIDQGCVGWFAPLRTPAQIDEVCALAAQLEEQGHLMATYEVVGSFENEPDIKAKYEWVYSLRNWRISHLEEITAKHEEMWDEEIFALKWLEADSVYQALDLVFIE